MWLTYWDVDVCDADGMIVVFVVLRFYYLIWGNELEIETICWNSYWNFDFQLRCGCFWWVVVAFVVYEFYYLLYKEKWPTPLDFEEQQ